MIPLIELKQILKNKKYEELIEWLQGQTLGVNEYDETCVYDNDLITWIYNGEVSD